MLHATRALVLLAAAVLAAQSQAPAGLDTVLQQAEGQRAAYVAAFRNVTATETRVTEVFDDRGRVEKQRTLVSNFLVYQSRFDPAVLSEYRIPLTVDKSLPASRSRTRSSCSADWPGPAPRRRSWRS